MESIHQIHGAAAEVQKDAVRLGLVIPPPPSLSLDELYDSLITNLDLRDTTRQLFCEEHYAIAVEEAFKHLNNVVKSRSGRTADGADLMRNVFSPKNPVLCLNKLKTESQRDQQLGYMDIFAGCMTGIRNPRAHEHRYLDKPFVALEMLALANHLLNLVENATRVRIKRKRSTAP